MKLQSYFGNIQVIYRRFLPAPPVSNQLYGDSGKRCFTLSWFENIFPHKINLIHRKSDPNLINCINDLKKDDLTDNTVAMMNSLSRPIENEDSAIQLFARNLDVDLFNYKKHNI